MECLLEKIFSMPEISNSDPRSAAVLLSAAVFRCGLVPGVLSTEPQEGGRDVTVVTESSGELLCLGINVQVTPIH